MIHALKIDPQYFEAVRSGKKRFELRKDDRDFRVGDYLALNEWDDRYTGRTELVKVTYIMNPNDIMTCQGNYALLSIEPCKPFDTVEEGMNNAPTVDAEPVKYGKWVDKCVRDWRCSECNCEIQKIRHVDGYCYNDLPNYCPNCGAKMDKDG